MKPTPPPGTPPVPPTDNPFAPRRREVVMEPRAPRGGSPVRRSAPKPVVGPSRAAIRAKMPAAAKPTEEAIAALARKAGAPIRIARLELEGDGTCIAWRRENPKDAAIYDQAYTLVDAMPDLKLELALSLARTGATPESLRAEQAERAENARLKDARAKVPGKPIDAFRKQLVTSKAELLIVLGDRVVTDHLARVDRLALALEKTGSVAALDIVAIATSEAWAVAMPKARRDEKLAASPAAVDPMPARRPAADPTIFLPFVGKELEVTLRNGMILRQNLAVVGPFDLLLGPESKQILVPIHALVAWKA